jgi:putative transcriptional regulator
MRQAFRLIAVLLLVTAPTTPVMAAESEASGIFLVANRDMKDPNFSETVVLVTQPRSGPPWGVIINRPLEHLLSDVLADQPSLKGRKDVLFFGGPVMRQGLVFLVRGLPAGNSAAVLRDVYFTGDTEVIEELLKRPDPTRGLRVYAGYAGWSAGQLQNEIARGGWLVAPADAQTIFDMDPARIWPELIKRAVTRQTRSDARDNESQSASQSALMPADFAIRP